MRSIWHDLRHGARVFGRRPGFIVVIVATLALGVGANTAIFSVINALFLQPLPLPDSHRLVSIFGRSRDGRQTAVSFLDFEDVRRDARQFEGLTAFVPQSVNLTGREEPTRVRGGFVSDNFFDVIGVKPAMGRGFRAGDDALGAAGVCVLDGEAWRNRFGGDPKTLGSTLVLNNAAFTVVGIMPAGFRFPFDEIEVWIPHHHWPPFAPNYRQRATGLVGPLARLREGASLDQGRTELETIAARLARAYPEAGEGRTLTVRRLQEAVVSDVKEAALVLLGAVTLVMLIACANVGALLLAHTASRIRELATRAALGASRVRLARQLLSETVLLWLVGGAAGLLFGQWVLGALVTLLPDALPGGILPRLDASVLAYTLALSIFTAVLFGILPAWRFSRPDLVASLKEGGRGASGGRTRLRAFLVVGQLALTLVLLAASGSMIRSLQRLAEVDVGYRPQNLLTMEYRLPTNKYPQGPQQWEFHRQVVERVRQLPGVRAASVIRALPLSGNGNAAVFEIPGTAKESAAPMRAQTNTADAYYFQTMGLPILRGRGFDERDHEKAPPVVVINRHMAERFWPGQDPVGHTVHFPDNPPRTATVVGVVPDVKHNGLDDMPAPQIYFSQPQNPYIFNTLAVRTEGDPMAMAAAVRGALWSVDKDQPVWKVRTLESLIEASLGMRRSLTTLLTAYAGLALLLAAVGLYGIVAHSVASRTREIGVRVALGAGRRAVLGMVFSRALGLSALGVAIGLAGAFAADRALRSLLYQSRAADPAMLGLLALLLVAVALAAAWPSARRATRVDPIVALRYE